MKGLVLAGGTGTRLKPMTTYINKHLLPVYDKPMIFYPISILLLCGLTDIGIVCNRSDEPQFRKLLDPFSKDVNFEFIHQGSAAGIPDAIKCARDFISNDSFTVILGDNLIFGNDVPNIILSALSQVKLDRVGCFTYPVKTPEKYGVVVRDTAGGLIEIVEKPTKNISNEALLGLYAFPKGSMTLFEDLSKSLRGEYEIVDVLTRAMKQERLSVTKFGRGHIWLDLGTPQTLQDAGYLLSLLKERQGLEVADLKAIIANEI